MRRGDLLGNLFMRSAKASLIITASISLETQVSFPAYRNKQRRAFFGPALRQASTSLQFAAWAVTPTAEKRKTKTEYFMFASVYFYRVL